MNCFCECEFREACEGGDKVFVTNKSNVFVANGRTGEILQRIFVENDEEAVGPLAVDGDDLYVVTKTRGMCVYSISGLVIKRRFGDCEAFQKGSGIVVGRDDVYVADGEQNRLLVFKKENGHFDRVLIIGGCCAFVCHPTSMALYKNRFLIVAEMGNNRIQVLDVTQKNDRLILVLDGFLNVSSVVVNPNSGVVYASLYSLLQIRKFQLLVNDEDDSLVCHVQTRTRQLDCSPQSLFLSCGDTKLGIVTNTRLCFLDMF